jgi:purine-nucleoside/S-methyl-5'-thioadenosine phosphorylase / adenosine deaminase
MTEPQPNSAFAWTQASWGRVLTCTALQNVARHLFTIANLELRDRREEWDALAAEMDVAPDAIRLIRQVHGAEVAVARRGATGRWDPPEADAIVSNDPSVAIAVRVADCAPILLADRRLGVVAAVHAGWRGTVKRVGPAGVEALRREFGSDPGDLVAAIGPCLGQCCGEVGEEVVEAFRAADHAGANVRRWFASGASGRPYLDLPKANRDQLAASGIPESQIFDAGLCSRSYPSDFHSYRAAGAKAGRMAAVIRSADEKR